MPPDGEATFLKGGNDDFQGETASTQQFGGFSALPEKRSLPVCTCKVEPTLNGKYCLPILSAIHFYGLIAVSFREGFNIWNLRCSARLKKGPNPRKTIEIESMFWAEPWILRNLRGLNH